VRQVSDDHYDRLAAAQSACIREIADILIALRPVRPRPMLPAGHELYQASMDVNRIENARRLVAKAIGIEPAALRPEEGAAT
jgi:hypothetical protein